MKLWWAPLLLERWHNWHLLASRNNVDDKNFALEFVKFRSFSIEFDSLKNPNSERNTNWIQSDAIDKQLESFSLTDK